MVEIVAPCDMEAGMLHKERKPFCLAFAFPSQPLITDFFVGFTFMVNHHGKSFPVTVVRVLVLENVGRALYDLTCIHCLGFIESS